VSNVRAGIGVGVLLGLTLSALLILMATALVSEARNLSSGVLQFRTDASA
jgi:hypothetical protein